MFSKEDLNQPVYDYEVLERGYYCRDGFVFMGRYDSERKISIYDRLVVRNPETVEVNYRMAGPKSERSLEDHIRLINELQLESVTILAESIDFIIRCPSLKIVEIGIVSTAPDGFDYSPLYELPCVREAYCSTAYGTYEHPHYTTVDLSRIKGLRKTRINSERQLNYQTAPELEHIDLLDCSWLKDLRQVCTNKNLKVICAYFCGLTTLDGIENAKNLEALDLDHLRKLSDVSQITSVASSLKKFWIDASPKVKDFSFLHELENLESLILYGSNKIPDLSFLDNMHHLKEFYFSMDILDGDLTRCLKIPYAYCKQGHRHYNLKNADLPKNR